ncbi:MAG: hypothetical protein LLG02_12275 [Pelosinus sp.]|nr:hypothetical protein [Pelosinus sp.]
MISKIFKLSMLILICSFMTTAVWAQEHKEEWENKTIDFNKVKNVAVVYTVGYTNKQENIADKEKLMELLQRKIIKAQNLPISIIPQESLINDVELAYQLNKSDTIDLKQMQVSDPARYEAVMKEWMPQVVDAILKVDIKQFGYTEQFVPAHEESYTDFETTHVTDTKYDNKGNQYTEDREITTPVERTRFVPDEYITYAHAGAEISLFAGKNQQLVWQLVDLRDANGCKVPLEMEERIFDRSVSQLIKVFKEKRV